MAAPHRASASRCPSVGRPSQGILPRDFYTRKNVLAVARDLLGRLLVVPARDGARVAGIIVETEAYRGPQDRASHAYGGRRTKRTETMYQIGGTAYVYFVYGMYHQFNVVTNVEDIPHAVLIRALEPVEGIAWMRRRRPAQPDDRLTNGPGKLCVALGIDRTLDRADLLGARVWIEEGTGRLPRAAVARGPRIGIDYAETWAEKPWRFWIKNNPYVSRLDGAARGVRAGGSTVPLPESRRIRAPARALAPARPHAKGPVEPVAEKNTS
jgi:DNA-3-methyladenine glycosylase